MPKNSHTGKNDHSFTNALLRNKHKLAPSKVKDIDFSQLSIDQILELLEETKREALNS